MNYESFYGGRRGPAFIIVKEFKTIKEMIEAFHQGDNYKIVNYDEYVLINTENKNNADNGKVFRRGYDSNNELGGAIFVGQIVGPAGPAPHLEFGAIDEIKEKWNEFNETNEGFNFWPEDNWKEITYTVKDGDLLPGKDDEGNFNDNIQWVSFSLRTENNDKTTAYVGMKIPYLVNEYTAESVNPYYNRDDNGNTDNFNNINLITRTDNKEHPFFEKWDIKIPKGIKGESLNKFRITTAKNENNLKQYNDNFNILENFGGNEDDQILVYDYYNYDKNSTGDPVSIYLGTYDMIKNISIDDEGTIVIEYTNKTDTFFKELKFIKSVTLNGTTGEFELKYNHETDKNENNTTYKTQLRWVNNIILAEDGTVTLKYTTGNDIVLDKKIKWITKTEINNDGTFTVTYNDSTTEVFSKIFRTITNITLSDNGEFRIKYNNGTPDYVKNLVWPVSINVNIGDIEGEGNQKLKVTYNNNTTADIGNPLNYIMRTEITDDYHLVILHADPAKRNAIIAAGKNYEWDDRDDWQDMGSVKDDDGILIGLNLDILENSALSTISSAISYLNTIYPSGLIESDLKGKLITIGTEENNKRIFAFDYSKQNGNYKGWYYLGDICSSSTVVGTENDEDAQYFAERLPEYGIWFILEGDTTQKDDIDQAIINNFIQ